MSPIIYGLMNRQIRLECHTLLARLRAVLCRRCCGVHDKSEAAGYQDDFSRTFFPVPKPNSSKSAGKNRKNHTTKRVAKRRAGGDKRGSEPIVLLSERIDQGEGLKTMMLAPNRHGKQEATVDKERPIAWAVRSRQESKARASSTDERLFDIHAEVITEGKQASSSGTRDLDETNACRKVGSLQLSANGKQGSLSSRPSLCRKATDFAAGLNTEAQSAADVDDGGVYKGPSSSEVV